MLEAERARSCLLAPGRAPRLAVIALAGAWLLSIASAAGTQVDALAYVDPAVADAREDFALHQSALAGLPGLNVSISATPNLAYGTLAAGEVVLGDVAPFDAAPAWSTGLYVGATVAYSYDRVSVLNDRAALLQAGADVAAAIRRGVFQALATHAQLLQAQLTQEQDAIQVEAALADATRTGTARAQLFLAALRLQQDEDRARLADLRRRAAAYGLEPGAAYTPLRFVLPETRLERTVGYRLAVVDRERAEARRDQDLLFGTVQGLELTATGVAGGLSLTARAGVIDARPGAELAVSYPAGADGWAVGMSATFILPGDVGRAAQLEHDARRARGRVEALVRDYPAHAARLRAEAAFAEREVALAEERMALVEGALAEHAPTRGALDDPSGTYPVGLEGVVADPAQAQAAANAKAALFQAWAQYVRSVYAYLDYIEARWQARAQ